MSKFLLILSKVVGQAAISHNLQPISMFCIAWNVMSTGIYFLILVGTIYYLPNKEDKYGYKGYSFISQIKYCVQLYGSSALLFFVNIRVTYYRKDIHHCYKRLFDMLRDFKMLDIRRQCKNFDNLPVTLAILLLLIPAALVVDVLQAPRPIPFSLWVCLYLPGFSCMIYICQYIVMFTACANRFKIINKTLEEFSYPELSCTKIYSLRRNLPSHRLLKTISSDDQNLLDKLLMFYDETCTLTQLLNKTCGIELVVFFGLTSMTIISFGYTVALDLMARSRGDPITDTNSRACDFLGIINFLALAATTTTSAKLKQNSEDTPKLLHKLINIYVDLEPFADLYSLQLSHQNATVSAAGFFILDKSIFLGLLSSWVTYFIILIQFND